MENERLIKFVMWLMLALAIFVLMNTLVQGTSN